MKRRRMDQKMEQELERDIADHIAMETEENIGRGMSPSEARYAALRKFGNVMSNAVQPQTLRVSSLTRVAAPHQIMGAVLGSGVKLAAGGLVLGLAIALPGAFIMASQVHGLSPWSVSALGLSTVIVMLAAVAAAVQPALRVHRIQLGDIVRSE